MLPLLLFSLFTLCYGQVPEQEMAVYMDSPMYVADEESAKYVNADEIIVERYNETTAYMYGNIIFLQDLGSNLILEILLRKEASGKFESLFSHDICDFCSELGKPDGEYEKYLGYFGIPTECPIGAGSYVIKDFILDLSDIEITMQHIGKYEAEINFYESTGENCKADRKLLLKLKIDMIIEPK